MSTELIVALDVDTLEKAEKLVKILSPAVKFFKIGSQLFTAYGPEAVRMAAAKGKVFLDLKFHDIPNTVRNAAYAGTMPGVFMMTVHASGGDEMLRAAVAGAQQRASELGIPRPFIVGVTVLTSGAGADVRGLVMERAQSASDAQIDGVVCAVSETTAIRTKFGPEFIIVNPGIRPAGAQKGDQKRVATPEQAAAAGASYIVAGRPVVEAADPLAAARGILSEIEKVCKGA